MRDINGNQGNFGSNTSSPDKETFETKAKNASSKGDYIDFEEIK